MEYKEGLRVSIQSSPYYLFPMGIVPLYSKLQIIHKCTL
jgi:hypothetical protein